MKTKKATTKKANQVELTAGKKAWITRRANQVNSIVSIAAKKLGRPFGVKNKVKKAINVVPTKVNSYGNSDGKKKDNARKLMIAAIMNVLSPVGQILSLPFETCVIEKRILALNNMFTFIGVERDGATFKNMEKLINALKLPIIPYLGSIGDKIYNASENMFSHLILDYCGSFNTFSSEIFHAMGNNIIQVGGTIAITFNKDGRQNNFNNNIIGRYINRFPESMFPQYCATMRGILNSLGHNMPTGYVVETVFEYCDTKENGKKGAAMALIIIRRVK